MAESTHADDTETSKHQSDEGLPKRKRGRMDDTTDRDLFDQLAGWNTKFRDGEIDAKELQDGLRFIGQYRYGDEKVPFSLETCILMINLMDRPPYNGKLNLDEFRDLLKKLNEWEADYKKFDKDKSGYIEFEELLEAIRSFGFWFPKPPPGLPDINLLLMRRYSVNGQVSFSSFIALMCRLTTSTAMFNQRVAAENMHNPVHDRSITINYLDYIFLTMCA